MKLVIVNAPTFEYALGNPRIIGGAERQQWLLARALARAGWAVSVGVREGLRFQERVEIEGVCFVGIGSDHFLWSCYRFLVSEHPDWWYWRAADHWVGPAFQIAKLAGVKTIFAAAFDSDVEPRKALVRRPWLWPLFAWGLSQVDKIFLQHRGQYDRLALQWQSKAYVVPSLADEVPKALSHNERKEYVAWVGILRRPKRADLLIEIARKLPNVKFVVCGGTSNWRSPPGYGEQIVKALQELPNINYMGQVETTRTKKVIAEAALLLSTADGEGFPNTFLEAWSCGTPVVSLTIDPDKVIFRKKLGIVACNSEKAPDAIKHLMASSRLRDEIAFRAQRYIRESHSECSVINILESAIHGV